MCDLKTSNPTVDLIKKKAQEKYGININEIFKKGLTIRCPKCHAELPFYSYYEDDYQIWDCICGYTFRKKMGGRYYELE